MCGHELHRPRQGLGRLLVCPQHGPRLPSTELGLGTGLAEAGTGDLLRALAYAQGGEGTGCSGCVGRGRPPVAPLQARRRTVGEQRGPRTRGTRRTLILVAAATTACGALLGPCCGAQRLQGRAVGRLRPRIVLSGGPRRSRSRQQKGRGGRIGARCDIWKGGETKTISITKDQRDPLPDAQSKSESASSTVTVSHPSAEGGVAALALHLRADVVRRRVERGGGSHGVVIGWRWRRRVEEVGVTGRHGSVRKNDRDGRSTDKQSEEKSLNLSRSDSLLYRTFLCFRWKPPLRESFPGPLPSYMSWQGGGGPISVSVSHSSTNGGAEPDAPFERPPSPPRPARLDDPPPRVARRADSAPRRSGPPRRMSRREEPEPKGLFDSLPQSVQGAAPLVSAH